MSTPTSIPAKTPSDLPGIARFVVGIVNDILRFSPIRAWAISGAVVTQAIRRKVLFMAPLVVLLAIAVAQWQRAVDPQDAVRQTTAFSLLASGILVVMVSVLMSCTSLPKDIESRVIYTIATKPTTRLEIALGKIIGLSRVSFYLLGLIGLLTWGYLQVSDLQARRDSEAKLGVLPPDDKASRPMLEYYRDHGTLHAREVRGPTGMSIYASLPSGKDDRWISGTVDSEIQIPVAIDRRMVPSVDLPREAEEQRGPAAPGPEIGPLKPDWNKLNRKMGGICVWLPVNYRKSKEAKTSAATQPAEASAPRVQLMFANRYREVVFSALASQDLRKLPPEFNTNIEWGVRFGLLPPPRDPNNPSTFPKLPDPPEGQGVVFVYVGQQKLEEWAPESAPVTEGFISLVGANGDYEYTTDAQGLMVWAADAPPRFDQQGRRLMAAAPYAVTGETAFAGRIGQHGQQLRGGPDTQRVAVMEFRDVRLQPGEASHAMEMRVALEGAAEDEDVNPEALINVEAEIFNPSLPEGQQVHKLGSLYPENHRPLYFNVPANTLQGGNFDVRLRLKTAGWLGLRAAGPKASLKLVQGNQPFAWNLAKSFFVLWMLSVLVTVVSVFCSTFLSWPIAVVLTLVILGGRWGAMQLLETVEKSAGRSVVDSIFNIKDPGAARVVSEGVDALVTGFQAISMLLPDVTAFAAIESIERGVAMPMAVIGNSLMVLLIFGVPMMILSWVFLRLKEVAP